MRNRILAVATAAVIGLILTACGQSGGASSGAAPTTSAAGSSSTPGLPHDGAPKVTNPIDATKWTQNPCKVVPDDEIKTLGMSKTESSPTPENNGNGKGCGWHFTSEAIGGSFQNFHGNGLSSPYQSHKSGGLEVFEPFTIDGYPAVAAQQTKVQLRAGGCGVAVGIRDDLVYFVQMDANDYSKWHKKPCDGAKKFAAAAMKTLTEGK